MILIPMIIFILIGLGAALLAKWFMPRAAPDGTLPLALLGAVGGLTGGLASLFLFGYGRARDYLYGYTHVYEATGATLPADWMSPLFALVGALLVLAIYRLARSRLTTR